MVRLQLVPLVFALRLGTISTQNCNCDVATINDIGVKNGHIPDSSFTASSSLDAFHAPFRARLTQAAHDRQGSAWCAEKQDAKQYLQVDLVYLSKITHIATQGRFDPPQNVNSSNVTNWVKQYNIQYSIDGEHYISYDLHGQTKVFEANKDGDAIKCCELPYPVVVQHIRFHPISWQGNICMRVGIFGKWNATGYSEGTNRSLSFWTNWWIIFWVIIILAFLFFIILLLVYCCSRKRHYAVERPKSTKRHSFKKNFSASLHREDPNLRNSSVIIYNSKTKPIKDAPYEVEPAEEEVQEVEADFTEECHVEILRPNYQKVVSFSVEEELPNGRNGRTKNKGSVVHDNPERLKD